MANPSNHPTSMWITTFTTGSSMSSHINKICYAENFENLIKN